MKSTILSLALALSSVRADFPLVVDHEPRAALVLAERPTRSAELAAFELQAHIEGQTGARLPILRESEALPEGLKPFYLGDTAPARELGLRPGDQQALLHVSADRAALFGLDEEEFGGVDYAGIGAWPGFDSQNPVARLGTLLGAYEILQRHGGIRWYMPTDLGTHIPKRADFCLPEGAQEFENWTKWRVIGSGQWGRPGSPGKKDFIGVVRVTDPLDPRDRNLFALRTRRGGEPFAVNHSMTDFYRRFADQHPEWWVDGLPAPGKQLKYGNPEVARQVIRDANAYFDRPWAERKVATRGMSWARGDYWAVVPNDNRDYGTDCKPPLQPERAVVGRFGSGTVSNYIFDWVNRVARGVASAHPDAWIVGLAYAGTFEPPDFPMEPHVAMTVAMADGWDPESLRVLKDWARRSSRLFTWEYHYAWNRMYPLRPHAIGAYAKTLREIGLRGMFMEMGDHNPALYHLDYYLMAQALVSQEFDAERELEDYYANFYGPAVGPMRAFWETLFEASQRSAAGAGPGESWALADANHTGERLRERITEARSLVAPDSIHARRIAIIEEGVLKPFQDQAAEARAWAATPLPHLKVLTTDQTVTLDGKLDDPAWSKAEESASFVTLQNQPMPVKTTVRVIQEGDALVIGFHCEEPRMQDLVTNHLSPSAGITTDDSVELNIAFPDEKTADAGAAPMLMRASGGREDYLQVMANSAGLVWYWWRGKYNPGEPKDLGIECAVAKQGDAWEVEIRIPLKEALDKNTRTLPGSLKANFMRNRPRGQDTRNNTEGHAVWSPTFAGSFHIPDRFGELVLPKPQTD